MKRTRWRGDVDLLHPDRVDVERLTVFVPNRVEANIPSVTDPEKKQRSVMIILSRLPTLGCRSLRYGKDPPSGWPIVRLVNSPDLEDLVSKSRLVRPERLLVEELEVVQKAFAAET